MRKLLFLCSLLSLLSCNQPSLSIGPQEIAIQHVNIIDVESGEIQENMSLLISKGRIQSIVKSDETRLSGSGRIIEVKGKYLIPGLWDMHTHLINEPYTREVFYPLFIANGITGIRVMAADCFEPCDEPNMTIGQHRNLQEEIRQGKLLGPRSLLASYYINGVFEGESSVLAPGTEDHGRQLAQLLKKRGVDFIKIYSKLNQEAYFGISDEAKKLELEFAGHVPLSVTSAQAAKAGQKSLEHITDNLLLDCAEIETEMRERFIGMFARNAEVEVQEMNALYLKLAETFDSLECQDIYEILKTNETWLVPTLRMYEIYYEEEGDWKEGPHVKYMPKEEFEVFAYDYGPFMERFYGPFEKDVEELRYKMVADMQEAGLNILAGSDVGEVGLIGGFSLHEELFCLQNAGLSPLEVLQSATLNPARYQSATDSLGRVEVGYVADLLLMNANPLEDIRHTQQIESVFANGRYLDRKELDSILLQVETYINNEK